MCRTRYGGYFYYSRTEEGQQYPIRCRKRGSLEAEEEITLDLNALAEGHSYLGLGAYAVSDDGHLLAYSTDVTGFRQYTLFVKDLRTGEMLPDRIEKTLSVVWAGDNKTLFYTVEDSAKRLLSPVPAQAGPDRGLADLRRNGRALPHLRPALAQQSFPVSDSESFKTTEVRFLPSDQPEEEWTLFRPRETDHRYYLDHHGDRFYVRTDKDDKWGAKNFRIVSAPLRSPMTGPSSCRMTRLSCAQDMDFFAAPRRHFRARGRPGADSRHCSGNMAERRQTITFPEPAYSVRLDANPEFETSDRSVTNINPWLHRPRSMITI